MKGPSRHNSSVWLLLLEERTDSKDTDDGDYSSPSGDISKTIQNTCFRMPEFLCVSLLHPIFEA